MVVAIVHRVLAFGLHDWSVQVHYQMTVKKSPLPNVRVVGSQEKKKTVVTASGFV